MHIPIILFLDSCSAKTRSFYSIRDNCGPAALDYIDWCAIHHPEFKLTRVRGYFVADVVVFDKKDFTSQMIHELVNSGLLFSDAGHRKYFIENSKYNEEWHYIPHYWCVDQNGQIHDPVGQLQFINTKLSVDLNDNRYVLKYKASVNFSVDIK